MSIEHRLCPNCGEIDGARADLLAFAQAVLDLPCAFDRDSDPLAEQQRRASELITTYGYNANNG